MMSKLGMNLTRLYTKPLLLLLLVSLFGGVIYLYNASGYRYLTPKESAMVQTLLTDPQRRCIGHYLMDLPAAFVADEGMLLRFTGEHDAFMESAQEYRPPFNQKMQRYEQELRATKPIDKIDGDYLKQIYPLANGMVGQVFERMESEGVHDVARTLEGYLWHNEVMFKLETKARDARADRYKDDRRRYPDIYEYTVPEKLYFITPLFSRLQGRTELQLPTALQLGFVC